MSEIHFSHRPVLLNECIEGLCIKPDGIFIDGTAGGGGHSFEIASRLGENGRLVSIDQDADAIMAAGARLAPFGQRVTMYRSNFSKLKDVCEDLQISSIDGLLLDLGVSSYQLDTPERGFAYQSDAPLDMRMDNRSTKTAWDVVNHYTEEELKRIIYNYGEDKFAPRIAQRIVSTRNQHPIDTTGQLAALIKEAIPASAREGGHHPAKRTFQAIRIEVNAELDVIEPAIRAAANLLKPGGRIAIITFHSLEDRVVKQTFADLAKGCTCPRDLPVCVCGRKPIVKLVNHKPILPSEEELAINPRSRSAKLRVVEKL